MNYKCPVCNAEYPQNVTKCKLCGFTDKLGIDRTFPIVEDAEQWLNTVVKPYREKWHGSLFPEVGNDSKGSNEGLETKVIYPEPYRYYNGGYSDGIIINNCKKCEYHTLYNCQLFRSASPYKHSASGLTWSDCRHYSTVLKRIKKSEVDLWNIPAFYYWNIGIPLQKNDKSGYERCNNCTFNTKNDYCYVTMEDIKEASMHKCDLYSTNKKESCWHCRGTGEVKEHPNGVRSFFSGMLTCSHCKGKGFISRKK